MCCSSNLCSSPCWCYRSCQK